MIAGFNKTISILDNQGKTQPQTTETASGETTGPVSLPQEVLDQAVSEMVARVEAVTLSKVNSMLAEARETSEAEATSAKEQKAQNEQQVRRMISETQESINSDRKLLTLLRQEQLDQYQRLQDSIHRNARDVSLEIAVLDDYLTRVFK